MKTFSGDDAIDPSGVSLKGYYWIGAVSIAIGVAVVFILNAVTPVEFILQRMARFRGASSAAEYGGNIIVFAVTLSCVFFVTTGVRAVADRRHNTHRREGKLAQLCRGDRKTSCRGVDACVFSIHASRACVIQAG